MSIFILIIWLDKVPFEPFDELRKYDQVVVISHYNVVRKVFCRYSLELTLESLRVESPRVAWKGFEREWYSKAK